MNLMHEKGATLVIAVVILMALTIIGLSAVTSSNLSMDVSGNMKARSTAFHAAESCLYYQVRRIKTTGAATTSLNYNMGSGLSCSASQPTVLGGAGGSGGAVILNGYSLEEGSASVSYVSYTFNVSGTGPRNTQSTMDVVINLPIAGGGY